MDKYNKNWTPEEDEILLESYGTTSMRYLIGKLKRTPDAIRSRYHRLEDTENIHVAGGTFSPTQVADALGVSRWTVINWIKDKGLPSRKLGRDIFIDDKRRFNHIDPYELWKWLAKNKERVDFYYVKQGIILPEPPWLEEEIQKAERKKSYKHWTKEQEETVWFWRKGGMTLQDIAAELGRTEISVIRKFTEIRNRKRKEGLDVTLKPVSVKNRKKM